MYTMLEFFSNSLTNMSYSGLYLEISSFGPDPTLDCYEIFLHGNYFITENCTIILLSILILAV